MPWVDAIEPPLTPAERQIEEDVRIGHEDRRPEPTLNQRIVGAVREASAQPGWRPIESAPTDGTIVIIPSGCGYCTDGIWKSWQNHRPIQWDLKWWMPLPAPPAELGWAW